MDRGDRIHGQAYQTSHLGGRTTETDDILWDKNVPGFGVLVMPSGRKGVVIQYRYGRRSWRMVIGSFAIPTPERTRVKRSNIWPRFGAARTPWPSARAGAS